ncbi:hypothetical protein CC2G_010994 [Coprinopsis cinerea AmutBmut pab1-1]|nr:hypothetical protein CC2G_010994 [Coprinopsis cinerea AmutBmut pab1-1]
MMGDPHNSPSAVDNGFNMLQTVIQGMKLGKDGLEDAFPLLRRCLEEEQIGPIQRRIAERYLIQAFLIRYACYGWIEDLNECDTLIEEEEIDSSLDGLEIRESPEIEHASALVDATRRSIDTVKVEELIRTVGQSLSAPPPGTDVKSPQLHLILGRALVLRYFARGDHDDLTQAATHFEIGRDLCIPEESLRLVFALANRHVGFIRWTERGTEEDGEFLSRWEEEVGNEDRGGTAFREGTMLMLEDETRADDAIDLLSRSLNHRPPPHPVRGQSIGMLGTALRSRFQREGNMDDLEHAIQLNREAVALRPLPHPKRFVSLNDLASCLFLRFRQLGDLDDLNASINLRRDALALMDLHNPRRPLSLNNLAAAIATRFDHEGNIEDLHEPIVLYKEALEIRPYPHPDRSLSLTNLSTSLFTRFEQLGDIDDLQQCISLQEESLGLTSREDLDYFFHLNNLSAMISTRYEHQGEVDDLKKCIQLYRQCLEATPSLHPNRPLILNNLANALSDRFKREGQVDDLNECISLHEAALESVPGTHPERASSLNNLANALSDRFTHTGADEDLDRCISLLREALTLETTVHAHHLTVVNSLATALLDRFEHQGEFSDLDEAISLYREAISSSSLSHVDRPFTLNNLAAALSARFKHKGTFQDLDEAIVLLREVLLLQTEHNPRRPETIHSLAGTLSSRFSYYGDFKDLEECISLHREVLSSTMPTYPLRFSTLNDLAGALLIRFEHLDNLRDLEECITLHHEALQLRPAPHPERPISMINLANALSTKFEKTTDFAVLEDCISLNEQALLLMPTGHPRRPISLNNLANALSKRFEHKGTREDINSCVELLRESLRLTTPSHPLRFALLNNLGGALRKRFHHSEIGSDLDMAFDLFREAAGCEVGSMLDRLKVTKNWASCARTYRPQTRSEMDAHQHTVALLPRLASLDLTLQQRQNVLVHAKQISSDTVRCAIERGELEMAVVFLATGRTVFWAQAPVERLKSSQPRLAQEFLDVSRQLEGAAPTSKINGHVSSKDAGDSRFEYLCRERERILGEIRRLDGFHGFLQQPSFQSLRKAADHATGPIVFLNANGRGCDSLIMDKGGRLRHVPLPKIDHDGLSKLQAGIQKLAQGIAIDGHGVDEIEDLVRGGEVRLKMSRVPHGRATSMDDGFRTILKVLWVDVVQPIVRALQLKKGEEVTRIWWCATGPFAFLPIHAAGIYPAGGVEESLLDYAVSSYIFSPQDLLSPPAQAPADFKLLAVIEPEGTSSGGRRLPMTVLELENIQKHVPSPDHLIAHIGSRREPTNVKQVLKDIENASIVHFGCHGIQDLGNALESCLLLGDGEVTMARFIREFHHLHRSGDSLAYLSACETAMGDSDRPDESLSLAATMVYTGFRGVVGTMWSIYDADAPVIADCFYRYLFRNRNSAPPSASDAAHALHLAVKELREKGRSFFNWVPFVHFGI